MEGERHPWHRPLHRPPRDDHHDYGIKQCINGKPRKSPTPLQDSDGPKHIENAQAHLNRVRPVHALCPAEYRQEHGPDIRKGTSQQHIEIRRLCAANIEKAEEKPSSSEPDADHEYSLDDVERES